VNTRFAPESCATCDVTGDAPCCKEGSFSCVQESAPNFISQDMLFMTEGYWQDTFTGVPTPAQVAQLSGAKRVFTRHAVMADGSVMSFGDNYAGERGDGSFAASCAPTKAWLPSGTVLDSAQTRTSLTLFHVVDGTTETIFATGSNASERLGRTGTQPSSSPIAVIAAQ
jgi:hypothetical protein